MTQEYTFVVDGTHRTATVTSDDFMSARQDAAFLLDVSVHQVSWLRPLPPFVRPACEISQDEAAQLNGLYSGIDL